MTTKIDAASDLTYTKLNKFSELYGPFPDYVKQASSDEVLAPAGLLPSAYADDVGLQLPYHTKAACYLSAIYFLEGRNQLPPAIAQRVASRLDKAASGYGILADLQKIVHRECELKKLASLDSLPDNDFAYVKMADDKKERHYPLRNTAEVKAAAQWFVAHRDHFSFNNRQRMAERITDKAAEHSVAFSSDLDYLLEKQAGRGVYDPKLAAQQLRYRAKLDVFPLEMQAAMQKLASSLESNPVIAEDPMTSRELAATVDHFDRMVGLNRKYSSALKRPEDIFFAGAIKQAAAFVKNACPTMTGAIYDHEQLSKLSMDQVRDIFGERVANDVRFGLEVSTEKLAAFVADLSLRDAVDFDQYMRTLGITPVHTKASALQLSPADRDKAAREYLVERRAEELAASC